MPNHIHLLVYQHQPQAMAQFMRSVLTSYSRYFNKRYKRSGSLFESRYKASLISDDAYLEHISRYIHLNPGNGGRMNTRVCRIICNKMRCHGFGQNAS